MLRFVLRARLLPNSKECVSWNCGNNIDCVRASTLISSTKLGAAVGYIMSAWKNQQKSDQILMSLQAQITGGSDQDRDRGNRGKGGAKGERAAGRGLKG